MGDQGFIKSNISVRHKNEVDLKRFAKNISNIDLTALLMYI